MKIIDYVAKQQSLFTHTKPSPSDMAVFCQLSYFAFEKFLGEKKTLKLSEINNIDDITKLTVNTLEGNNGFRFYSFIWNSKRYKNVEIIDFLEYANKKTHAQFAAFTFKLTEKDYVIAFRGTDITLNGWRESLMLAYQEDIPSFKLGLDYLTKAINSLPQNSNIYLTGHSKGGNVLDWAFANLEPSLQDKITRFYNFEGPGFISNFYHREQFQNIKNKITKYVTFDSIIGILLNDYKTYQVISASGTNGFSEHSIYTWNINPVSYEFYLESKVSKTALAFQISVNRFLLNFPLNKRKEMLEGLIDFLEKCGIKTQIDFTHHILEKSRTLFKSYATSKKESKRTFSKAISIILRLFLHYRFVPYNDLKEMNIVLDEKLCQGKRSLPNLA